MIDRIARAANVRQLNALLSASECIEGRGGVYFWMNRGQIIASGSFYDLRSRIANAAEYAA